MVMFGHPNALAAYLVLVLGLGLGLILYYSLRQRQSESPEAAKQTSGKWQQILVYLGTFACLLGIFASGSRNGLLVAISQLLVFGLFTKASRVVLGLGAIGIVGLIAAVIRLGIGGRSLLAIDWSSDPRIGVWKFGLELLSQRPWLGWGLGNFKLQYPPGLIPEYQYIAHPHNFWLLLAVEAGIPVMILLTLWVGKICYLSVRQLITTPFNTPHQAVLLIYLLAFWGCVAFALFDVTFYDARINTMNWVLLTALYTLSRDAGSLDRSRTKEDIGQASV